MTAWVGLLHFEPNEVSCKPSLGEDLKALIHSGCLSQVNVGLHCGFAFKHACV